MSDAEARANLAKAKLTGLPESATMFQLTNGTDTQVYFWMVLTPVSGSTPDYPADEEITDINDVYLIGATATGEGQIKSFNGSTLVGYFWLNPGTTVVCAPNKTFSVQIYTNGSPGEDDSLCCTPYGVTLVELTINVDGAYLGGETVDISEVNGVNAIYSIDLPLPPGDLAQTPPDGFYPFFFCCSSYLFPAATTVPIWGSFGAGMYIPVSSIINNPGPPPFNGDRYGVLPYGAGTGNVGVYPYGCDLCTGRNLPGCASIDYPPADTVAQTQSICQVQRGAQYQIGGIVNILLVQCPYP